MNEWITDFHNISVQYIDKIVRVKSDAPLEAYLAEPGNGSLELADHILSQYEALLQKPLDIGRHSLAIEILGHVFVENFAEVIESVAENIGPDLLEPIIRLMEKVQDRTEVIDCGEASVDGNRFVWDALSPFHSLIYLACGRRA